MIRDGALAVLRGGCDHECHAIRSGILRADGAVPREVVRERVYGGVRVVAEWPMDLATPEIRVGVEVGGDVGRNDAPAYVELFFQTSSCC